MCIAMALHLLKMELRKLSVVYRFPFCKGWYEATNECMFVTECVGV
jgi:hypothetical protein